MKTIKFYLFCFFLSIINSFIYSQYFDPSNVSDIPMWNSNISSNALVYYGLENISNPHNYLDIAVFSYTNINNNVNFYGTWNQNLENGTFSSFNTFHNEANGNNNPTGVRFMQLQSISGKKDFVITRQNTINVCSNSGGISDFIQSFIGNTSWLDTGNFNSEDNLTDLIIGNGSTIQVYKNLNNGNFHTSPDYSFPITSVKLLVRQITDKAEGYVQKDENDKPDLITYTNDFINHIYNVYVYKNESNSFIIPALATIGTGYPIDHISAADFGDGYNYLIVSGVTHPTTHVRIYQNAHGQYIWDNPVWSFDNTGLFDDAPLICVDDLNKDGLNDLILVSHNGIQVAVFLHQQGQNIFNQTYDQYFQIQNGVAVSQISSVDIYNKGGKALLVAYSPSTPTMDNNPNWGVKIINADNTMINPQPPPPIVTGELEPDGQVYHPKLIMNNRAERDWDHYEIYKSSPSNGFVLTRIEQNWISNTYTDYTETVILGGDNFFYNCYYEVKSLDLYSQPSIYSNPAYYQVNVPTCDCGESGTTTLHNPNSQTNSLLFIPKVYSLSQNYPNPFNSSTKIDYSIPINGFVTLKVFDVLGREVVVLVNEFKRAGNYSVQFNSNNISSGMYFYKITLQDFSEVKKMILIK